MKTVLVFGATGGIGEAIVKIFAKEEFQIGIHYSNNKDKAIKLSNELTKMNVKNVILKGDVSNEEEMKNIFDELKNEFGGIDVVINTAGIMRLSPIIDLDMDVFDQVMKTNVRGTFIISKHAVKYLKENGVLINFSTTVTRTLFPQYGAYSASKAAVEALTLTLAREMKGKNIRVNAIAPGPTATPLFIDGKTDEQIKQIGNSNPLERIGTPNDIAEATLLVVNSKWINGQVIFVNGGMA